MSIPVSEKLRLLQTLSGLTQSELASELGVSFAAFNRWINNKAKPRRSAETRIDRLCQKYAGQKVASTDLAETKSRIISAKSKNSNALRLIRRHPDICDSFILSLTYNSNRIEGSTLSENETAAILFHHAVLKNKSLVEQMKVKNHETALRYLFDYLAAKKPIDEKLILKLHGILMNSIRPDAGAYRSHGVRIVGSRVVTANHLKVPILMKELAHEFNKKRGDIITQIAEVHAGFEKIHPFSDGNGRIGRLLAAAMALRANLAPIVVVQKKKARYISCLHKAQVGEDFRPLIDFIADAILEGYKILERK